ncbi:MAG: hypothetical protein LBU15_00590 [Rickettsiales bacterium]|nr:hypothetical protein [Rickettsiales bacterium]
MSEYVQDASEHMSSQYLMEFDSLCEALNRLVAVAEDEYPEECDELFEFNENLDVRRVKENKALIELFDSLNRDFGAKKVTFGEFVRNITKCPR